MNDSTDPSRPAPLRRIAILGMLFVAAIMSCGKDVTGPLGAAARYARGFSWSPIFPPAFQLAGGTASGVVQFNRVHVVLHHDDGTVALDTVVDFPAGADSLTLSLTVKLLDNAPSTGEPMSLNLGYLDAAGDTVFKGGPISITAAPPPAGGGTNPPVQVPVTYTGPGSNAFAVVISPRSTTVVSGAGFSFSAVATDINHTTIPGTPIVWSSLDPNIATITSGLAGAGIAQNQRGPAHIVAQLLTGQADTVIVNVTLPASVIVPQSGNTQTGVVGTQLAQPLVVKVSAADGVAVAGTTVNFAVATGGGSVANASVVSDANGLAQTKWTLGTSTGAQTVTASAGTLTNSPLTFTATANPVTATKLVNTTPPANGVAGTALGPIVFTAEDNNGNVATGFNGQVIVSLGTTVAGATLSGTTSVTASAGVATFSTLAINKNGAGYTLVATSSLPSDTTAAFNIGVGAPSKLVFTVQPSNATANAAITPAIVVNAQDSQGNPTPLFTGSVTLGFATNPASATLGGTASVNAVAGVATFSGITVSAAGTGYSLSAAATGLTSATSSLFNIGGGVAASIVVASGAAQTGAPSAALAQPIVIQVNDASANPVAGTTVNFAIVTGGGSVTPASGVSNAAGRVQTTWTLGAVLGAQSISATSTGLTGSPLTINATATVAGFSKTWTGATSTAWTTASNWSPAGVPVAGDSVFIPVGTNQPTISSAVTVKHLQIGSGVLLSFSGSPTVTITGNLVSNGAMGGNGTVAMTGTGTLSGNISPNITVSGTYSLSAGLNAAGSVSVSGSLDMNGQIVGVFTTLSTTGTGTITMNSGATVTVGGDITFGGGSETGKITAGTIIGAGNFTQSGSSTSFVATGTNTVQLTAAAAKSLSMTSPATSTFWNLTTANTGGLTLTTNVTVGNLLTVAAGTVTGAGLTVTAGSLSDASVALSVANITLTGSTISASTMNANVSIANNPAQLLGNVTVNGNVNVTGNLQLNTHYLTVSGNFSTLGSGQLTMTNASDSMSVAGNATFAGGVEAGILAAGKIKLAGNFLQVNNSGGQEFKANAPHTTVLTGSASQTISFANPDTTLGATCLLSCFGNLTINKTGGTVTYVTPADHHGKLRVMAGVTQVMSTHFITATDSTITPASTPVDFTRFGTTGNLSLDPSATAIDTIGFYGTSAQTIPLGIYNQTLINGTPTVGAGGFSTTADLIVNSGGNLTLGGQGVVVGARFITTGTGTLTMTNAADSLFVTDSARFSGGAEAGLLTNGALVIYKSLTVQGAGQFAATGSHMTYLVGTNAVGCNSCDIHDTRTRRMTRAQYQATVAARTAARAPLVAMLVPRATAIQAAVAAKGVPTNAVTLTPAQQQRSRQLSGGVKSASHIPLTPTTSNLIAVSFATTSGNSFGNVRILGGVDWQTPASVVNNLDFDPTQGGTLAGNGHATVGNALAGPKDISSVAIEALELAGTGGGSFADLGYFSPDTTIWSGTNQQMAGDAGGRFIDWYNVVVNSSTLFAFDDSITISVGASLFITNSGQLNLGRNTDPTEMNVNGSFETHQSGTLRMDSNASSQLNVADSAWFDGGSSTGLLTQGQIYFGGNFRQTSTNSTSSYSAVTPHQSYFAGYWAGTDTITFANPSNTLSHFGDFYLAASATILQSDVYAVGQLQTGNGSTFTVHSAVDHLVTSNGSNLRNIIFDNVRWKTAGTDGTGLFPSLDGVTFQNISATTMPQFDYEYSVKTNIPSASNPATLGGFTFSTTPTGAGVYIKVVGPDTLTMSSPFPALNGGFISVSGGGAVNGWPSSVAANWLGVNTVWTNTANWSTGLVPDASTDVTITCDCSAPATSGAQAVHSLTMSGTGEQLTLGGPFTVNGDLSIAANSNIAVGSNNLTLLGNVYTDTSAAFGGVTCSAGNRSTGAIISGTGTHNVYGKFCALTVGGTYLATGKILVKHTTGGDANLTIQSGGSLGLNGHRVDTDSMNTTGGGTFTMQNAADSLVLHGAPFASFAVNFNGGSETGLITAGTVVDRSAGILVAGTAFDASGTNTLVADTVLSQSFRFNSGVAGHGLNNVILKDASKNFQQDLYINGTLTLDVSMTTSGAFQATANNLYVNQVVDNTGNINGGLSGAYWVHITGNGAIPAIVGVDSLIFDSGGNNHLATNLTAHAIVVRNDGAGVTGLYLNGHVVNTNNFDFTEGTGGFLGMTNSADSLNVGTGNVFFNGSYFANTLTTGGIAAGGFYQGYTNTTTPASGNDVNSYSPSGTHRLWLTQNAKIIFANPGTGSSLSHFNTLHNPSGYTSTLYSDVFVDDSIYFATSGTAIFNSNTLNSAATTRLITTKGLADNTISTGIEFGNVTLKFVDGQAAPTTFSNVQFTGFPLFGGTAFEIARTSGSPITNMTNYDFSALGVLGLLGGGHLVSNTGTVAGWSFSSVNAGLLSALTSFTLNAAGVFP